VDASGVGVDGTGVGVGGTGVGVAGAAVGGSGAYVAARVGVIPTTGCIGGTEGVAWLKGIAPSAIVGVIAIAVRE